jgi:flagellar hook protein FlgE
MSLYDAMMIGVAGLDANSRALSIASSNIANVNTVGYKTSQSAFSTMVAAAGGPNASSDSGVMTNAQQNIVQQGLLFATSSPTDLGISGNGFFVVNSQANDSGQQLYTRAGSFTPDANGNYQNAAGLYLQGWPVGSGGAVTTNPAQLQTVNLNGLSGKGEATTEMTLQGNLQASADIESYSLGGMENDATQPQFQRTIDVYDSQGGSQPLTISYVKTNANTWSYEVSYTGDTNNLANTTSNPNNPTNPTDKNPIASGQITFNSDGSLADVVPTGALTDPQSGTVNITIPWDPSTSGLQPQNLAINMGTLNKTDGMAQFDTSSVMTSANVDGAVFGNVTGVTVTSDGTVYANYSNGLTQAAYKVPLATFTNADGLTSVSGNAFAQSPNSGNAEINGAGTAGAGTIASGELEGSTVDLATEFTNMITTQRAYSASARVITTASQMLDELMQDVH